MLSFCRKLILASVVAGIPGLASAVGTIQGTIRSIHVGNDNWYGVRFILNVTNDQVNGECSAAFIYTEPEPDTGHKNKVAVFTAAYLAGKTVHFWVIPGRNGYCKLLEGYVQ